MGGVDVLVDPSDLAVADPGEEVLADPTASVHDAVLIEDDVDMAAAMPPFPTSIRTLITDTHRYSRDDTGEDEVDELHTADDERTNLAPVAPPSATSSSVGWPTR